MIIDTIEIKRFKNLNDIYLNLKEVNVFVGSNNSGKSSILQAIQFAVSVAQTTKIARGKWNTKKDNLSTSISQGQLIYSPLREISALAPNGILKEHPDKAIFVEFGYDNKKSNVIVKKGRNKNIVGEISGQDLGEKLQNIENPFSIYP